MKPKLQRDALESIVNSLDTGTLVSMLASQGIHVGEPGEGQESPLYSTDSDENTQSWNNIKIELEGRPKGEPLHSSETYMKPKMEEKPEYIASENPPSLEPWMNAGVHQ